MERKEALLYLKTIGQVARLSTDRDERREYITAERLTPSYQEAFRTVRHSLYDEDTSEGKTVIQDPSVLWAINVKEQYLALPKQTTREKKQAQEMLDNQLVSVITGKHPVRMVLATWKAHTVTDRGDDAFSSRIANTLEKVSRVHWQKIPVGVITDCIRLSLYDELFAPQAEAILTNMANAPRKKNESADMYYKLALAAVQLSTDHEAFKEAVRIGTFQTDLLVMDSLLFDNLYRVKMGFVVTPEDEQAFKKYLIAKQVFMHMEFLTRSDTEVSLTRREGEYIVQNRERLGRLEQRDLNYMFGNLPRDIATVRHRQILAYYSNQRPLDSWPESLKRDPNDELNIAYQYYLADRYVGKFLEGKGQSSLLLTLYTPEGDIIYVHGQQSLLSNREDLAKFALNVKPDQTPSDTGDDKDFFATTINRTDAEFLGESITLLRRHASASETSIHPLQILEVIGFPEPIPLQEEGKQDAYSLARTIRKEQLRFINPRGIRIPLDRYSALRSKGLSAFELKRDPLDVSSLAVSLFIGTQAYDFFLNEHFLPDLRGKQVQSPEQIEHLTYTLLQLLYPILCIESKNDAQSSDKEPEQNVVSRMGHLRWLTRGQRFRNSAVALCWEYEGKDLYDLNFQRIERHKTNMESTYVRPIITDDTDLPPVTVRQAIPLSFTN